MLYIFSGLPGTGKTTLANALAHHQKAVHLRIDTIEQKLRDQGVEDVGEMGYAITYVIAKDNLVLDLPVVADSVNPIAISRTAWQAVAIQSGKSYLNIEVVCSDLNEHRQRIESRVSDIPTLKLPSWDQVQSREYAPWEENRIVIDTAGRSPHQSLTQLLDAIANLST